MSNIEGVLKSVFPFLSSLTQDRAARDLMAGLPLEVTSLISGPTWKGGTLVVLPDPLGRPPSTMLGKNYIWLMPFVKAFPHKACARSKHTSRGSNIFHSVVSKMLENLCFK